MSKQNRESPPTKTSNSFKRIQLHQKKNKLSRINTITMSKPSNEPFDVQWHAKRNNL